MDNKLYEIIIKRRSIRKFKQTRISKEILMQIVNAGRLAPSAANLQSLEFVIIEDMDKVKEMYSTAKWAGYITPNGDPADGEEPVAYIAILINTAAKGKWISHDIGASAENIILASLAFEIGSCWLGAIDKDRIKEIISIPDNYELDSIIALGYPAEQPEAVEMKDSVRYWKDSAGVLNVPKRNLKDIMHWNKF